MTTVIIVVETGFNAVASVAAVVAAGLGAVNRRKITEVHKLVNGKNGEEDSLWLSL